MKKNLLNTLAFVSLAGSVFAQLPVNTNPENKKAVLEEFTGVYCGYCPDGHQKANAMYAADPNNVVLINIHSGVYANVAPGEPDFTTPEGTAIDGMSGMGITGYPAGDINRTVFTGGVMAGDRGYWTSWGNTIKSQPAYCNVALEGSLNVQTRVLTVNVEVYYTGNSPQAINYLNVFLLEDSIHGIQHNYGTPIPYNAANYNPDGSYNHNHVLRKGLTQQFGLPMNNTTAGTTFTATLTYVVPNTYGMSGKTTPCLLGNLKLAAFVTETNKLTINANHGPITLTGFANAKDIAPTDAKSDKDVCGGTNLATSFKFVNYGSDPVTSADFEYRIDNTVLGTYNWSGSVNPYAQSQTINLPNINFTNAFLTNTLVIRATNVNGSADNVVNNNEVFRNIPFGAKADSVNMQMKFVQDQYGTEDTWYVLDEATSVTITSGGPYNNLSGSGTAVHLQNFTITPNTCYVLQVKDAFGDGINAGTGVGYFELRSGTGLNALVYSSNGQYGSGDKSHFSMKTAGTNTTVLITDTTEATGIASQVMNIRSVKIYPNPASGLTNISLNLIQNETINVSVMNSMGQEVFVSRSNQLAAGNNNISLDTQNWANGVYFISLSTLKGTAKTKLVVSR